MFRSGAGRPPFRATPLASIPSTSAALPSSGVPHGAAGDGGCTSPATESAILKELRNLKRQQQQGMENIRETDAREDLSDTRK